MRENRGFALSFAACRIREGDLDSRLDEMSLTSEIREVNMGFNRMARELARIEEDRSVMLAGISHDLRTPLARLRLEMEMSVSDEEARQNMAGDIDQLDAIIDKFMDYARPGEVKLSPVHLSGVDDREIAAFRDPAHIVIESRVAIDTKVMADDTELGRVLANLFENARRYGRGVDNVARLKKVAELEHSGNLEAACFAYTDLAQRYPASAEAAKRRDASRATFLRQLDREATTAFQRQNLDLAIAKWDRMLEIDPGSKKARLERERALDLKRRLAAKQGAK